VRYAQDKRAVAQTYIKLITCTYSQHVQNSTRALTILRTSNSTLTQAVLCAQSISVHQTITKLHN